MRSHTPDTAVAPAAHALCVACDRHRASPRALVCAGCTARAHRDLDTIRDGWGRLDATPGQQRADDGRSGGHASRPPLRIPVLTLDVAPAAVRAGGPINPHGDAPDQRAAAPDSPRMRVRGGVARPGDPLLVTLGRLVDAARADELVEALRGPRTVPGEALRLAVHLDAIAGRWWVADAYADLATAAADVRRALGEEVTTVPLGACPRPGPHGRRHLAPVTGTGPTAAPQSGRCGALVRAHRDRHRATCAAGHRWDGADELRGLGAVLGEAYLDAASLAEHLAAFRPGAGPVAAATLRKWAERDGWRRRRDGARTLYRVGDAVDGAYARWDRRHPVHGPVVPPVWLEETTVMAAVGHSVPELSAAA